jgi:hypothetical protein
MYSSITAKPDRTIDDSAWSVESEDPLLVAAVAAALVEFRRHVGQANGQGAPDPTRSNWRIVTRVAQLRQLP